MTTDEEKRCKTKGNLCCHGCYKLGRKAERERILEVIDDFYEYTLQSITNKTDWVDLLKQKIVDKEK